MHTSRRRAAAAPKRSRMMMLRLHQPPQPLSGSRMQQLRGEVQALGHIIKNDHAGFNFNIIANDKPEGLIQERRSLSPPAIQLSAKEISSPPVRPSSMRVYLETDLQGLAQWFRPVATCCRKIHLSLYLKITTILLNFNIILLYIFKKPYGACKQLVGK